MRSSHSLGAGDVAMCSGERALEALRARREAIAARGAIAAIASEPALTVAGSKRLTLDRATALGIASPRSLQVSHARARCSPAPTSSGIRSSSSRSHRGARLPGGGGETVAPMLAYDRPGLEAVAQRLVRPDAPALLQQVAAGVRETHKLVIQDGRVIARLVMVAERCWPPLGGSSVMRMTVEPPADSYALALALVTDVGLRGRQRGRVPPRCLRPPAADGDQRAHLAIGRAGAPRRRGADAACSCAGRVANGSSPSPTTAAASASAGPPARRACSPAA